MTERLKNRYYVTKKLFIADLQRIISNCREYNPPDSEYCKCANTLEKFFYFKLKDGGLIEKWTLSGEDEEETFTTDGLEQMELDVVVMKISEPVEHHKVSKWRSLPLQSSPCVNNLHQHVSLSVPKVKVQVTSSRSLTLKTENTLHLVLSLYRPFIHSLIHSFHFASRWCRVETLS